MDYKIIFWCLSETNSYRSKTIENSNTIIFSDSEDDEDDEIINDIMDTEAILIVLILMIVLKTLKTKSYQLVMI